MAEDFSLKELVHLLADERGLDLRGYKHTTLERRVRRRMFELKIENLTDYAKLIRENPTEVNDLLNTVLINVTEFFRDPQAWDVLRTEVMPKLLRGLRPGDMFRAWCPGCASGEEPYSLAIVIADLLGDKLADYDVKIYATDIDEEALNIARRGEYRSERVRRVRPDWRERYFHGNSTQRVVREIRRIVIFGRSNLLSDAPISHCDLVLCRNVLIYFDAEAQKQIFKRLHYALNPNGILFLGKAESKLTESRYFRPIHPRWRIFQRITEGAGRISESRISGDFMADDKKLEQELELLRAQQRSLMDNLKTGIMVLDGDDTVISHNEAAVANWGLPGLKLTGKKINNTELVFRCPELPGRIETTKAEGRGVTSFECRIKVDSEDRALQITIKPMSAESGGRTGTIVCSEDITSHEKLQTTIEQLEATGEELQSANEELETTNEELQSTNEELETTNEELQSTNEELETTNEELQSLNEELENMNEELERRTRELNQLTSRYAETLRGMPWPVLLVDRDERIQIWNTAAQRLFGVGATSVVGVQLDQLPLGADLRKALVRKFRAVLTSNKPTTLRKQSFSTPAFTGAFDLRFTPISGEKREKLEGVLVMFGPLDLQVGNNEHERKANPSKPRKQAITKSGNDKKRSKKDRS